MKQNSAAKHHAKRPHTVHRDHTVKAQHSGKKVFDVMRPGKAPASPTSRPVIVGHKPGAQKAQVAVSGIGEAPLQTVATQKVALQPLHSEELDHTARVAAAASAATAAAMTDPEDMPAGAPPVALTADQQDGKPVVPPASTASSAPPVAPAEPSAPAPAPALSQSPVPAPPVEPVSPPSTPQIDPGATHNLMHGKTVQPLSQPTPAPASASAQSAAPVPASTGFQDAQPFGPVQLNPPPSPSQANGSSQPASGNKTPELHPQDIQDIVVSHHATSVWWHTLLLLVLIIIFGAIALNILLDAEIIDLNGIPHTDFF